jgi:hypothetical protein
MIRANRSSRRRVASRRAANKCAALPMKTHAKTQDESLMAKPLAAEDLRCGDFVSVLHEFVEWPSCYWPNDSHRLTPSEPVRIQQKASDGGIPHKVKAICLPFVFVKLPDGQHKMLDVRRQPLVRLSRDFARPVWQTLRKQATHVSGLVEAGV